MKPIPLGDIEEIELKLEENSCCPINFGPDKMSQLTVYVGKNGSGKSFIQKMIWCGAMFASARVNKHPINMQFILDTSIPDHNLSGHFKLWFTGSPHCDFTFKDGEVIKEDFHNLIGADQAAPPVYMSAETCLFSSVSRYIEMKNMAGFPDLRFAAEEQLESLSKSYRLYDLFRLEELQMKLDEGISIKPDTSQTLMDSFDFTEYITGMYAAGSSIFVQIKDEEDRNIESYGNGHQSLLMMIGTR